MLIGVFSCDTDDKCGDGTHLAMVWKGTGDASVKKLLKKIHKERSGFFGISRNMDFKAFCGLYEQGGFKAVSNAMEYGYIEPLEANEWING